MRQSLVAETKGNRSARGLPARNGPVAAVVPLRSLRLLFATTLLALVTACATMSEPPPGPKVEALDIEGTKQVSEGALKDRILTSATPWYAFWPFGKPHYFDPNAWQADLRRIERYYAAQGFYQAEVVANEVQEVGKDTVRLEVSVQEGKPTRIAAIHIDGLEPLSQGESAPTPLQRERLLANLPVREGDIFREEAWGTTKEELKQRLRELGYAEAEVTGEVHVDVATQEATIHLQAKPGLRYRFGNIFVATDANPQVPPKRIIEQAQGAVHKGAYYSESALAEAQARVFRMGVFGAAKVNRGAPDRTNATVPIVVDVREAPFRSIRLGGGIGVDAARQEVRLLGEWTHRNFHGGLRRLTLRGRAGYAFIPNVIAALKSSDNSSAKSGTIFNLTAEFEQPRFLLRDLRLQSSLTGEKGVEQAYDYLGGRLQAGVIWQPHPSFSVFPSYNLQVYRLNGSVAADATVPPIVLGCATSGSSTTASSKCTQALSFVEIAFAWDRRDDPVEPRDGYYLGLSVQRGGGPFFGGFDYVRLLPDLRFYESFGERRRVTVAAKLRMGTLNTLGNSQSSIVTRFFSGGANFMRGFNGNRLSPMVAVGAPDNGEQQTVPVGGNSLFESSVELRYQLSESFVVAGFYDSGLVGVNGFLRKDSPKLFGPDHYHAVGLGMRYLTVVGPIRLDLARRLNIGRGLPVATDGYTYPTAGGCFGIGRKAVKAPLSGPTSPDATFAGSPEGMCALQISIGEAF
ncbi:polymerase [Corallococcus sp. H22C18031201]|nr:polymerase [Corallococcus sp. H22C18031201]